MYAIKQSQYDDKLGILYTRLIQLIDRKIQSTLDEILHHKAFQSLESRWRGLRFLCGYLKKGHHTKCKMFDVSWQELSKDITGALEFDQSNMFKHIYDMEFDHPGGEPFGLLIADFYIGRETTEGIDHQEKMMLERFAQIAASAFVPIAFGAKPQLLGINTMSDLYRIRNFHNLYQQNAFHLWDELRTHQDSRFLVMTLPRFKLRHGYQYTRKFNHGIVYHESIEDHERDVLWGNGALVLGCTILTLFQETGWFTDLRGYPLTMQHVDLDPNIVSIDQCLTEAVITPSMDKLLSGHGIMSISFSKFTDEYTFLGCNTVLAEISSKDKIFEENHYLSCMLHYLLCVSRFAHYLKHIGRTKIGNYDSIQQLEYDLQNWLLSYTAKSDDVNSAFLSQYPLKEAKVQIQEKKGDPGNFSCTMHLEPHAQFDEMQASLTLVTNL